MQPEGNPCSATSKVSMVPANSGLFCPMSFFKVAGATLLFLGDMSLREKKHVAVRNVSEVNGG